MALTAQEFSTWLSGTAPVKCTLVEVGVFDGVAETTLFLSNKNYATRANDVPRNTTYLPVLKSSIDFSETISLDNTASISFGDIAIYNYNGELDSWIDYVWSGRSIKVYVGDVNFTRDNFTLVFSGVVDDIGFSDRDTINVSVRDILQRLNTPVTDIVLGPYGIKGQDNQNKDQIRPLVFGEVHNISPLLIDDTQLEYLVHNGLTERIIEVRDNGVPVDFIPNLVTGTFRLTYPPAGTITCSVQGDRRYVDETGVTLVGYRNTPAKLIQRIITGYGKVSIPRTIVQSGPLLPHIFNNLDDWTGSRAGSPIAVSNYSGATVVTDDPDFDTGILITDFLSVGNNICTKQVVPAIPGRTYEVTSTFKVLSLSTDGSFSINIVIPHLTDTFSNPTTTFSTPGNTISAPGVYTETVRISNLASTEVLAWGPLATSLRFGIRMNTAETGIPPQILMGSLRITDVTEVAASVDETEAIKPSEIDLDNFETFDQVHTQPVGVYVQDKQNILEVCQQLAGSVGAQLVASRLGVLKLVKISTPAQSISNINITEDKFLQNSLSIQEKLPILAAVKLGYCKNWTTQSGMLTSILEEHKVLYSQEYLTTTAIDLAVRITYKLSTEPEMQETLLLTNSENQVYTEALRRLDIYKVPRFIYSMTCTPEMLGLSLGDPVVLYSKRFGLHLGKPGIVVSLNTDWGTGNTTVGVLV